MGNFSRTRRALAFIGPGLLVAVGYMDPGNWTTSLQGGSQFGMTLLWVILLSNLMAMLLQTLSVRMGIATGKDLAETCRDRYAKPASIGLWLLAEGAIIATDVAEVIGSAVALDILFGLPLVWGVLLTGFDTLVLLALTRVGFRLVEAVVGAMTLTIFVAFALNIFWAGPPWAEVGRGLITPRLPNREALTIAVGIIGATVMPHNLYLHSHLVRDRLTDRPKPELVRGATTDTIVSLGIAFFVNASILVLAATVFHPQGVTVDRLEDAYALMKTSLGGMAALLFAVALLASGQASTITGTIAGQAVMEGFLHLKIKPWLRRLITRSIALVPALILVSAGGHGKTATWITLSQVVLSMQLPFAVIPLIQATADRRHMKEFTSPTWMTVAAWLVAAVIVGLNMLLLWESVGTLWLAAMVLVLIGFAAYVAAWRRRRAATA